ncbi:Lariat debranching enzyme [Tritrichomonas foetus]|uniref:Lariat debranching enzyme n=1 Tax=Tritrichomonas foetus TaxID=1144522 RepID=A0A1J4JUN9_9EUKA|nr:Lariat debranching enzyme [Tritrichomonas foetus]|eukprot:OHT02715.1 Lariat debranching enzyme [Tritrichomonas foetus]
MKIFVTGCLHGEWDRLIQTVEELIQQGEQIDLILVTGDAQTMRYQEDLNAFAAPPKYRLMGSFYKIYNGEKKIPRPTIVVGGNHESADFLHLLPFGGWLAEDVFYIGRAGSLSIGDITISAISGLYKHEDYYRKVDENFPLRTQADIHTWYHIRAFSDFQLLGLPHTQIMLSHEWPAKIPLNYGGEYLKRRRRDLIESDRTNSFGLLKGLDIIHHLKPSTWFASHHHITFRANVEGTQFHAIPKPTRNDWFIVADIDGDFQEIKYRGDWISILKATTTEMTDPAILKDINWDERWEKLKPQMEKCEDSSLGDFELNPFEYTAKFCTEHNVYCPNPEIREYMASRKPC